MAVNKKTYELTAIFFFFFFFFFLSIFSPVWNVYFAGLRTKRRHPRAIETRHGAPPPSSPLPNRQSPLSSTPINESCNARCDAGSCQPMDITPVTISSRSAVTESPYRPRPPAARSVSTSPLTLSTSSCSRSRSNCLAELVEPHRAGHAQPAVAVAIRLRGRSPGPRRCRRPLPRTDPRA